MSTQAYLLTVTTQQGEVIETSILHSKEEDFNDAVWKVQNLVSSNFIVNLQYLCTVRKPRKLIPLLVANI